MEPEVPKPEVPDSTDFCAANPDFSCFLIEHGKTRVKPICQRESPRCLCGPRFYSCGRLKNENIFHVSLKPLKITGIIGEFSPFIRFL
jgi:hypothetical protein